jgi:TPP-dependent 2-oxoacid decarboxylase
MSVMDTMPHTDPITDHTILSVMDHNVEVAESFLKTIGMKELIRKLTESVKKKSTYFNKHNLTSNLKQDWHAAFLSKAG